MSPAFFADAVSRFSRLIIGSSGSGKSLGSLSDMTAVAEARDSAMIVMDPHGLLAENFALQLVSRGMQNRLLYDRLSSFDRILAGFKLTQSVEEHFLKRESENTKRIMSLIDLMWRASRREGDPHSMPTMSEGADIVIRLMLFQREPMPLSLLPYAMRFSHPICQRLIEGCTDEEVRERMSDLRRLKAKNADKQLEDAIGPIKRLVRQTFGLPAFRERCDGSFDLEQALVNRQIIIVDGSDDGTVSKQSVTAVYGALNLQIDQVLRRRFTRTGKPTPVVVVWEEAGATDIIGPNEVDMLRELRKTGFAGWIINQDSNFGPPEQWETIKSCTPEKVWYNPGDDELGTDAGKSLAFRKLDPLKVKHVHETERMVFDKWENVTRTGKSKSGSKETETETNTERAKYKPVIDRRPEFFSLDDQIKLEVQKLMGMGKGYRMIVRPDYVSQSPEYVQMLPEPWPARLYPGLAEKKLERAIRESQQRAEFKTPVELDESLWQSTTTSSHENATSNETNSSTFHPLPQNNRSKQASTPQPRKRGKGTTRR
ncbi:MAG TPA: hypothetical protein VGN57_18905 [Pirellulaceae bacterium]|jgi:hypothetical protein|nr:hypothetical protein [Pirellulaceae bacterium]